MDSVLLPRFPYIGINTLITNLLPITYWETVILSSLGNVKLGTKLRWGLTGEGQLIITAIRSPALGKLTFRSPSISLTGARSTGLRP